MKIETIFETTTGSYPQDIVNVFFRDDQGHYTGRPALLLGLEEWQALKQYIINHYPDDVCVEHRDEPERQECGV